MTIQADIQHFEVDDIVEMFELYIPQIDTTYYFCSSATNTSPLTYDNGDGTPGGHNYTPIPIDASGYDASGRGTLPQPKIRVADMTGLIAYLIRFYDDLLGCKFTRKRTLRKYLTDPSIKFEDEVYYVSRKSGQNQIFTEFTLCSALDLQGLQLPRKLVLKNYCSFVYRRWDADLGAFVAGTCPYDGTSYFNVKGEVVTMDLDKCGKKLKDCELRYPNATDILPTTAYPGVYNVRS